MKTSEQDTHIMRELINQVAQAAGPDPETKVTTIITRPMWNAFCRASGLPENCEPTEWKGLHGTRRVYGSRTIVVESDLMASASRWTG